MTAVFDTEIGPTAHVFKKGRRILVHIVNGDSAMTGVNFTYFYDLENRN